MIPILHTTGLMLFVMAAARWFVDDDAALAQMPPWSAAVLIGLGALMVGLGVLNMLVVRERRQQALATAAGSRPR